MADQSLIKKINCARMLNAIRNRSPISRSQIAEYTGLDKKSVTNLLAEYVELGIVKEVGKQKPAKGRPHTMLAFDTDKHFVMGIAIYPKSVTANLMDYYGEVKTTFEIEFPLDSSRESIMAAVKRAYERVMPNSPISLDGVGVSIPGIMDFENGKLIESVYLPSLIGIPLLKEIAKFIDAPLYLEEATRAKALAEKWFGVGRKQPNIFCVDLGVGIGASLIHNGRLFSPAHDYIGELGHVMIEKNGRLCRCGKKGCLEIYASEHVILEEINKQEGTEFRHLYEITMQTSSVKKIMEGVGYHLGVALSYVVNIICPPMIVLNGTLMNFADSVLPNIQKGIDECAIKQCAERVKVVKSELVSSTAVGAGAKVLATIFEVEDHYYV
jgi:predicted NBD/HSP70 family sugar kinase